jgi:hypothetical protein
LISQPEIDVECGRVLMRIWTIFHAERSTKLTPFEIVTNIAAAIHSLPQELLTAIGAEVKRKTS